MNSLCPNLSSSLTESLGTDSGVAPVTSVHTRTHVRAHPGGSDGRRFSPQGFARHLLVADAVVDQRLVPHGVQSVLQGLGAELVGLEGERKKKRVENASLMSGVKGQEKIEKQRRLQARSAEQHLGEQRTWASVSQFLSEF